MSTQTQTASVFNENDLSEESDKDISQEYEKLNKKCDTVIRKIKKRKAKQTKNN